MNKICPTCKKIFYKKTSDSKKYWKVKKYCSIICSGTLYKKGEKPRRKEEYMRGRFKELHHGWKGGRRIDKNGYVIVYVSKQKYEYEHRLVMERILGRKLQDGEVVHHINHNRQDNRPENLELFMKKEHDKMETTNRWKNGLKAFGRA